MSEIMERHDEEDINFAEALDQSFKKIHKGEKVKGTVAAVNNTEAIVDTGTKYTGYVPLSELTDDPSLKPADVVNVGDELDLIVIQTNDQDGTATLSKKKVDEQKGFEEIVAAKENDTVLEGTVQGVVKGGIIVAYAGVRVFIPASQSGLPRGAELDTLVKTKVRFVILEVNEHRRRAVGSIRAVQKAEKEAAKAEKEARKNQKSFEVKELRITPNIEQHDFDFKAKNARRFLEDGNKVKITVRFRGRELNYVKAGEETLNEFIENLSDISNVEKKPLLEGKNMSVILAKKTEK